MKEFINGVLSFNADVFIIPNSMSSTGEVEGNRRAFMTKTLAMNNIHNVDPTSAPVVQLWFVSDDLDTDNIARHGFDAILNGNVEHFNPSLMELLPAAIFKDKKEGDTFVLRIPINLGEDECDIITGTEIGAMEINLTLAQDKYRYRRDGGFDGLLKALMEQFTQIYAI